jgi:hypothetical protein
MLATFAYDRDAMAGLKRDLEGASNREDERRAAIASFLSVEAVCCRILA